MPNRPAKHFYLTQIILSLTFNPIVVSACHKDAQYDGQIVKSDHEQQSGSDNGKQDSPTSAEEQAQTVAQYSDNQAYGDRQQQAGAQQQIAELARLTNAQEDQQRQAEQNTNDSPDTYQQQQQQQPAQQEPADRYQEPMSTPASSQLDNTANSYMSTNSLVAGAQLNHRTPSDGHFGQHQSRYAQQQADNSQQYNYIKLDQSRQQTHLAKQQAQHQANLADLLNSNQGYQTTTPMSLTTLAAIEEQQETLQQTRQQPDQPEVQQQQQQALPVADSASYTGQEQVQQQTTGPNESMLVNESPLQVPISDQQSLIPDQNQDSNNEFVSSDDATASRQLAQPAAVYQVYQAYYAPKDHKPLPGYVRLSLDEFNELFRDAEIQYVDRNLNKQLDQNPMQHQRQEESSSTNYEPQASVDMMKAAGSESHSILIDRRSISDSHNRSQPVELDSTSLRKGNNRKSKLGQAVRKIISIRTSRPITETKEGKATQLNKAQLFPSSPSATTIGLDLRVNQTSTTTKTNPSSKGSPKFVHKSAHANKKPAPLKKVIKSRVGHKIDTNQEVSAST